MVAIPKEIVKEESLTPGMLIKIDIQKPVKSGFGIFKGIGPFSHEDRLDTHE
ncbi:MAG: hypothetical protein HY518_03525 [Candidatus Aenigmarchaeota archaeon]|nr:hypothetical protein [Candidatus Aenigmarchaeota archaeon]